MSDVTLRRKRLTYASRYRGMLESDLFFGRFADEHLHELDEAQLDLYEALLREADVDLMNWVYGRAALPEEHDNEVFAKIRAFKFCDETS